MKRLIQWLELLSLLAGLAGIAAFGAVLGLWLSFIVRDLVVPTLSVWHVACASAVFAVASMTLLLTSSDWFGESFYYVVIPFLIPAMALDQAQKWCERRSWPRSMKSAVDQLVATLDSESLQVLREMPEENLGELHFGLAWGIRNGFGLWAGNCELLAECGTDNVDVASNIIVHQLWKRLRADAVTAG